MIEAGEKIGKALECTKVERRKIQFTEGAITTSSNILIGTFQCECGSPPFDLPIREAQRRAIKDCGCGRGRTNRRRFRTPSVIISAYFDQDLAQQLQDYAYNKHMSVSKAITEITQIGLDKLEADRQPTEPTPATPAVDVTGDELDELTDELTEKGKYGKAKAKTIQMPHLPRSRD